MKLALAAVSSALLLASVPAMAQAGPEQLDQIEPGAGAWQAEYYGIFSGEGSQEVELLFGLSDALALGTEIEFEGPRGGLSLDSFGLIGLVRIADPETRPVGAGLGLGVSLGRDGTLDEAEARLILETRRGGWWAQADAIVRHAREDGAAATGIAYGASLQHALGGAWLGIEASGQAARISGPAELAPRGQHYAGPSLTFERDLGSEDEGGEVEIGLAWMQRVAGEGPGSGPRIFAQFTF